MLQHDNDQPHWRNPIRLVRHDKSAWQWRHLDTQHMSRLQTDHDVAMDVERTESVRTLHEQCQYAVLRIAFGWLWLPVPWLTLIDSNRSVPQTAGGGTTRARLLRGDTKTISTDFFLFNGNLFSRAHFTTWAISAAKDWLLEAEIMR
jgi:hypothetical protein